MISAVDVVRCIELGEMRSKNIWNFYHFAKLNRIGYYFLYKIREHGLDLPHKLAEIVRKEDKRYRCVMEEFVNISSLLDSFDVDFVVFKSLKPFPSTTVDIDVVVFDGFRRAVKCLVSRGYRVLGYGPESVTLQDPRKVVGVDLYREVAVSRLKYLSKNILRRYVEWVETDFGPVRNLRLECDLVCVAAHCFVKEQIFTLSEYFYFVKSLGRCDFDLLLRTAFELCSVFPLNIIFSLVNAVYREIYGKRLVSMSLDDWEVRFEVKRFRRQNFQVPFKFHPLTVLNGFLKLFAREKEFRKGLSYQASYLMNLSNFKSFFDELVKHATRKTY